MSEPEPIHDPEKAGEVHDRHRRLAAGLLALPNLFLRSALMLFLLYGILTLVLMTFVMFDVIGPMVALAIGVVFALLQYTFGPWIMDLSLMLFYRRRWIDPGELPSHLRTFVSRVCEEKRIRFPMFCILDDGAPQAFTYGHHPNNARIVISRGLMELLEPVEVEAVVAHELGHVCHWDMALMTLANLVPLLLFFLYDLAFRLGGRGKGKDKDEGYSLIVAAGAYVLYVISEYLVLWFSRAREYHADRFAGQVTGNPNALATALVKIAYGLAAADSKVAEAAKGEEAKREAASARGRRGLEVLNIFDQKSAVNMVMCSAGPTTDPQSGLDVERVKSAMQWDLWNPWALYYELHSTHPLVAKRLLYLADQAAAQEQSPFLVFDRKKPESYWDDFLFDVLVILLPILGLLTGVAAFFVRLAQQGVPEWYWLGGGVALMGLGMLLKTSFAYRGKLYPNLTVAALMGHVKVSPVRPVEATLTGTIIGKGIPGMVWSEDFVMRDSTGILFLDYRQPLSLWSWLFGILTADRYQGKEVRVTGWFRREPLPYLEIKSIETLDGSQPKRRCYVYHASILFGLLVLAVGVGLTIWPFLP